MKTLIIVNPKGGAGKSTLTVHLAATSEFKKNGPTILIDTDPQGSASDWINQRKSSGIEVPRYGNVSLKDFTEKQKMFREAGAKYLFVDTSPSLGAVNAELFRLADLILIPLNPTPADLRSLAKGMLALRDSGKPFVFVLSRVRANLKNNAGTAMALQSLGMVLPTRLHERVIYAETFAHGLTTLDINPGCAASLELISLWNDVKNRLNEI